MTDFYQNGIFTTLHDFKTKNLETIEAELKLFSGYRPIELILPSLYSELEGPALKNIVKEISEVDYINHVIIGLDKDSFALNSGKTNFLNSKKILDFASSNSQSNMWSQNYNNGRINKYWLVENLVSPNYTTIKEIYYDYHRRGLDVLIEDKENALQTISQAIGKFNLINRLRPNSIMQQMFFQSKNDEIISLYKNHNNESYLKDLKNNLNRIAPFFSEKWNSIK